jgi:hypothetical protein
MSLVSAAMSKLLGAPSITIRMHFLTTGNVVHITRTEKRKVQIGSQIQASGTKYIMLAAIVTPIDCTMSPRTWIIAALMLMFVPYLGMQSKKPFVFCPQVLFSA